MILNVSGRTDIVAFYCDWFKKRYQEGFVDVRNPFNRKLVSRIYFEDVDAILFCTKNPLPILDFLDEIHKPIIFQVTLTPYKKDIEPNVLDKSSIIEAIKRLSSIVGCENLYIRYDPIFLSKYYNIEYHCKAFERLCSLLDGYVTKIIISFIDDYKNVRKHKEVLQLREFREADYEKIGKSFSTSAKAHHMSVQTCFEERNLVEFGFIKGECLSKEMALLLTGKKYRKWTARKGGKCSCVQMVDIGYYNSCNHLCKYCYANYDETKIKDNMLRHDSSSSLLIGTLEADDVIKRRKN